MNRPELGKRVSSGQKVNVWKGLYKDCVCLKYPDKILIFVGAGSDWIEVFPLQKGTTVTVTNYLSKIVACFVIPKTLVSDNGP